MFSSLKGLLLFVFWVVGAILAIAGISMLAQNGASSSVHTVLPLLAAELPMRLVIPKIRVDAAIESVGRTEIGALDVPRDPANAGWFNQGPRPGEKGSAVLDGHYGWVGRMPAVFDELRALHTGDEIYVKDAQGTVLVFVVREMRTYGRDELVSEVFASTDGMSHLNLITCVGAWNSAEQKYAGRLVVFADAR